MRRRDLWLPAAALLALICPGGPLSAQPAYSGPEIRLTQVSNSPNDGVVALAAHPGGRVTVLWRGNYIKDSRWAFHARRLDARGRALGPDIAVGEGYAPALAAIGSGFVVAGVTAPGGTAANQGRIFGGDGLPRASFRLDTSTTGGAYFQVAADRGGNFAVVWTSSYDVFLRRFSATGVPRGEAVRVPPAGNLYQRYMPVVARAPGGEIVAVWHDGIAGHIFGQRFGRFGDLAGDPFEISFGTADFDPPAAAFFADGSFLVSWLGWGIDDPDGPDETFGFWGRIYDRNGRAAGPPFRLEGGAADDAGLGPVLASAGDEGIFAVWAGVQGIHIRQVEEDGSLKPELLIPKGRYPAGPPVAATAWDDGNLAVGWERAAEGSGGSIHDFYLQRFATAASAGEIRFGLAAMASAEGDGPLSLRVERREGNRGEVSAAWTVLPRSARAGEDVLVLSGTVRFADGDTTPQLLEISVLDDAVPEGDEVFLVRLTEPEGGASLGMPAQTRIEIRDDDVPSPLLAGAEPPVEMVSFAGGYLRPGNPSVAVLAGGGFLAAWLDDDFSDYLPPVLEHVLHAPSGEEINRSFWTTSRVQSFCMAAHAGGGFTMAGALGGFSGRRFDAAGRPRGDSFPLVAAPVACSAGRSGGLLVLSEEPSAGNEALYLSAYGNAGQILGALRRIDRTPARGEISTRPDLATDAAGRGIVVWRGPSASGDRIYARRVDPLGRPVGPEILVDALAGQFPGQPAVAAAPDGRFVVVWEGEDDGSGSGIFARRFDATGAPLGAPFQVSSRTRGDQISPVVAVQGDGRFLVVWQTAGESLHELRGQLYAADGRRLGSDFLVEPVVEGTYAVEADLSTNAAGHYAVIWRRIHAEPEDTIVVRKLASGD